MYVYDFLKSNCIQHHNNNQTDEKLLEGTDQKEHRTKDTTADLVWCLKAHIQSGHIQRQKGGVLQSTRPPQSPET